MAETLNIKITVDGSGNGGGGSSGGGGGAGAGIASSQAKSNAQTFFILERALTVGKQLATQVVNIGVSRIGFYSGNTTLQSQIQNGMSMAGKVINIATAFAANPILGGVALVSTAIGEVDQYLMYQKTIQRQNYAASQLARRAGFLANGNR